MTSRLNSQVARKSVKSLVVELMVGAIGVFWTVFKKSLITSAMGVVSIVFEENIMLFDICAWDSSTLVKKQTIPAVTPPFEGYLTRHIQAMCALRTSQFHDYRSRHLIEPLTVR